MKFHELDHFPIVFQNTVLPKRGPLITSLFSEDGFNSSLYFKWTSFIEDKLSWMESDLYNECDRTIAFGIYRCQKIESFCWCTPYGEDLYFDFIGVSHTTFLKYENLFNSLRDNKSIFPHYADNDLRSVLFDLFKNIGICFLVSHEATHLRYGHVDYKQECISTGRILEGMDHQAFEMDADGGAAVTTVRFCDIMN